jgi:hypothetical protein
MEKKRKISPDELKMILENHHEWLSSEEKDLEDPKRANLRGADLF